MSQIARKNENGLMTFEESYKPITRKIREDHIPQSGDIYQHNSDYGCPYIRLNEYREEKSESGDHIYKQWTYEGYDIETGEWKVAMTNYSNRTPEEQTRDTVSHGSLFPAERGESSYTLLLIPFEKVLQRSQMVYEGKYDMSDEFRELNEVSDETALATKGHTETQLLSLLDQIEEKKNYIEEVRKGVMARVKQEEYRIRRVKEKMEGQIAIFRKQIKSVMRVISLLELYAGINEEIFQICEGEVAPEDTPLSLRQMILYMDEEVAVADDGGYDYKNKEDFYKWLLDPKHRDQVIPEPKSIIAMKPRRKSKNYNSGDSYWDAQRNSWNKQTFVLIRNGENLYALESDNLWVYGSVFPRKRDWVEVDKSKKDAWSELSQERAEEQSQDLMYRSYIWAMLVSGLLQRSEVLSPHPDDMDIFKNENGMIQFIYDDESTLSDGHKRWVEWQKEINSNIGRGSRVIYSGYGGEHFRYYSNKYSAPDHPEAGLYTLEENQRTRTEYEYDENGKMIWDYGKGYRTKQVYKDKKHLGFYYKPGGTYWTWDGEMERKNRSFWVIEDDMESLLNYDRISIEDIDYFLSNRIDRPNYLSLIPLLQQLKKHYTEEKKKEDQFIDMIVSQLSTQNPKYSVDYIRNTVEDCIEWWKYKVIWKRPITQDDAKAYRMITAEVRRRLAK